MLRRLNLLRPGPALVATALILVIRTAADDLDDARALFRTGKYPACIQACEKEPTDTYRDESWRLLQGNALLAAGRYEAAEMVVSNALKRTENSVRLRLLGIETANHAGNPALARTRLREINELGSSRLWAYREPPDLVALGRVALMIGADPKTVLERLYSVARKADPTLREVWMASGELALEKHDFALAAKTFDEARKQFPDDADMLRGLAESYQSGERSRMLELLQEALGKNPNHVPSLLLLADHLVDAEEYDHAERTLNRAIQVNAWHPEVWAYLAVLAHFRNDAAAAADARGKALTHWKTNPRVDHIIGRKLSQRYRFIEGAACQRQALAFDPGFLPARIQLAEDLLRLGEESEGWKLAEEVHAKDAYDITAYNLVTLKSTVEKFQVLTNADFVVKMTPHEAAIYGDRALALLQKARERLSARYGIEPARPTTIEIFPEQKDFAVRTFGEPGNPGYLGVCFGRVITANSPASQAGNPANWEAVLWHEFCHVVTLQMTHNKMPRWLSEGISVFEELQANPAWGQTMMPRYREMMLGDDLKPVAELSAAFLSPKTGLHLQFAYYQSALVVEFLVTRYGFDALKGILQDLGEGVAINAAITKRTAPMKEIESGFKAFARARAEAMGPGLDWFKPAKFTRASLLPGRDKPAPAEAVPSLQATNAASSGRNYWVLMEQASNCISERQWAEAKAPLQKLIELYPDQNGANNAYALLAAAHRGLNETNAERVALEKWASLEGDALDATLRLMDLGAADGDWKGVALNAERTLAVNPLLPQPYRMLARAAEELGETPRAIGAWEKLALLDPPDPAEIHYRLARLLRPSDGSRARRHVLSALEDAPRFREAHQLLLELGPSASAAPKP